MMKFGFLRLGTLKRALRYGWSHSSLVYAPFFHILVQIGRHRLEKQVAGRTIAIVGPSPTLSGRGLGKKIDSFDRVFKFNRMIDFDESLARDYGHRCDILVHGLLEGERPGYCGKVRPAEWRGRLRDLHVLYPFRLGCQSYSVIGRYLLKGGRPRETTIIDKASYAFLEKSIGARPTSGCSAIYLAVCGGAKEVSVFGMDFFAQGHHPSYFGPTAYASPHNYKHDPSGEKAFLLAFLLTAVEEGRTSIFFNGQDLKSAFTTNQDEEKPDES
jgi:hypothetical protein